MRAAVVAGPGRAEVVELDPAPLTPGDVRVAVAGCGVCGSNLPVWEGRPWFDYPLAPGAPGHEAWGTVVEVGADVAGGCKVGDPVAVLAERAFAEEVVVPAADAVVVPEVLAGQPFPGEALGCGCNIAARAGFAPGQTVAVVGVGFIGAVVTALATGAGAEVVAVSRRPFALEIATAMGARHTLAASEPDQVVTQVEALTAGRLCDVVVEAVGTQQPLDLAGRLTGVRGRLVVAGFHQDGPRTVDLQLWNWRGIDVVNAHERDREVARAGIRAAADAVADGRLDPTPLYTHRSPLDQLQQAMDALVQRPDGFLKALVVP